MNFNGFSFDDIGQLLFNEFNQETYEITFNIYIGNQLTQSQSITAPRQIIEANFIQLCQQLANSGQPMKLEMIRKETLYDNFEKKYKEHEWKMDFKTWKDDDK